MVAASPVFDSRAPASAAPGSPTRKITFSPEARFDAELVRRFSAGDESAFEEIITRHHEKTLGVAFALLHNHADAEEIAQDTFVRAYRSLNGFRGDSALGTWLHRITVNLARNRYWHGHRRFQHATSSFNSAFSQDNPATLESLVASEAPGPVQEVAIREFTALVAACIAKLDPGHREILTRRGLRHSSYEEIARALGISIGTVKSRIARAREQLRLLLVKSCPDFGPDASPHEWLDLVPDMRSTDEGRSPPRLRPGVPVALFGSSR